MTRVVLKTAILFGALACGPTLLGAVFRSSLPKSIERPWIGADYWANPLQDWRLRNGRIENHVAGGDRNIFLLTHEIADRSGDLTTSVRLGKLDDGHLELGFAGFRVGVRGDFHDYRDSAVRGEGLNAGVTHDGKLFIGQVENDAPEVVIPTSGLELRLAARPSGTNLYAVALTAHDASGKELARVERPNVPNDALTGGIALVSHSGPVERTPPQRRATVDPAWAGKRYTNRGGTTRFWFENWSVSGLKVDAHPNRAWGPILWAMHTLNQGVLKLTAQLAPVEAAVAKARLQRHDGRNWQTAGEAPIDPLSRTATFRVTNWNDKQDAPYRVLFRHGGREHMFEGTVRRDPADKPYVTAAVFTGNNDLGFPHQDIVRGVGWHKPDFLIYTGDQIYERVAEYGIQRAPLGAATLDYLRKWYLFGWEYRDLLRDTPAVALPDDHDVYHGNIWGAGGKQAEGEGNTGQDSGGYVMPAEWVNMVQRTQTSHMADPYDATPIQQGIGVYYGPMSIGGVSFAVIEDRKWKSAPAVVLPKARIFNGWPQNPNYDAARDGDAPGANLLGARQLKFLNEWAQDWSNGTWMKAVISQTIFAGVATLPSDAKTDAVTPKLKIMQPGEYPEGEAPTQDHDTNGWPQAGRNQALRAMRRGLALHIAGDQHLGSTIQYGIDDWHDASWAICVPSVANVFPRRWFPQNNGLNTAPDAPRNIGDFRDGFGNRLSVYAVSNPMSVPIEPKALYDRAPGYGIVKFFRASREIELANWPRWVDPSKPGAKPYEGWPIRIEQTDNGMPGRRFALEEIASTTPDPVVQVIDDASGEPVYTLRIQGKTFRPTVWKDGTYTVKMDGRTVSSGKRPQDRGATASVHPRHQENP
jgi:phosphodiesterase/alkaline phosphatase D-like protein